MARARNIKPGLFRNELLIERSVATRLLFVGMWTLADREGRLENRPKKIRLELFPYDDVDVEKMIDELREDGFIDVYDADGKSVIEVVNFLRHQTPHGTEKDSTLPNKFGFYDIHERNANGYVTGSKRSPNVKFESDNVKSVNNVKFDENNVDPQEGNVGLQEGNVDLLGNNTLNPDSLNPDSLNPDIKTLVDSKLPTCPANEILDLFSECLPELAQPRTCEGARLKSLQSRWKWVMTAKTRDGEHYAENKEEGLDFFRRYFLYVKKSDFLCGRSSDWQCGLDWLLNASNFAKVLDGNYENKAAV